MSVVEGRLMINRRGYFKGLEDSSATNSITIRFRHLFSLRRRGESLFLGQNVPTVVILRYFEIAHVTLRYQPRQRFLILASVQNPSRIGPSVHA